MLIYKNLQVFLRVCYMKYKFNFLYLLFFAISFLTSTASFAERQLYSYDEIGEIGTLGGPERIKIVGDTHKGCAVQSHHGSLPYSPIVFSMIIPPYLEDLQSGEISGRVTVILNNTAKVKNEIEMTVSPRNTVRVENKAVSLLDNKVLSVTVEMCLVANQKTDGILFYEI